MAAKNAPEVRQCQNPDDPQFGAVAVKSDRADYAWGVFHPRTGGHWDENNDAVQDWAPLTSPSSKDGQDG